jgi:hypothetical protein
LLAAALHAQSVDGTLTNSITHAPIPSVIVTLLGPARYNDTTDETGAFHIDQVRPGKYVLNIVKAGYVLPLSQRATFQIDADTRLSVEMDPLSNVEGRVRYPDGRPAPRAPVWLSGYPNGSARTGTADAGGHFVFDDVKPGQYLVRAAAAAGDPKAEGEIWAATYFPSSTDAAGAEPIRVATGISPTVDVRLRSVLARRIRGIVRDETGRPAAGVAVTMRGDDSSSTTTAEDGTFDLLTRDGDWRLNAARKDGYIERQGLANITVARHDVENLEIRLALPFSLPFVIDREAPPNGPARPIPSMLFLTREDGPLLVHPAGDSIPNLYPGRYRIQALNGGPGMYVESAKLGEVDIYDRAFDLWDGSVPLRVTYKFGAPVVRGVVESGEGARIVVFTADESSENYQSFTAGRGGSFQFELRPGDYYIVAVERSDASARRIAAERGTKVHLEKGSTTLLNLKIVQ